MTLPHALVLCATTPQMQADMSPHFKPVAWGETSERSAWLKAHGPGIEYLLTDGHIGVPQGLLEALPDLRAISSYGVGYDAIDTAATNARGIPVAHTPAVLNAEVATTALLLYLACYRNFLAEAQNAHSGAWAKTGNLPLARTADGRRVGILGLGRIGLDVAQKLEAFGAEVHYHNRSKRDVPYRYHAQLIDMAHEVDALICVAPGGAATHHLVNAEVMSALGPEAVLVNVGRGSTVDEPALIRALSDGRLGWAGLDVFAAEPNIPERLRALPNVVLTPHIGSATVETRQAMGALAVRNLVRFKTEGRFETPVPESLALMP